jgi:DNA-directed RNA polymerase specialized sigma24 family protein
LAKLRPDEQRKAVLVREVDAVKRDEAASVLDADACERRCGSAQPIAEAR